MYMTGSKLKLASGQLFINVLLNYQFVLVRLISKDKLIRKPHTCLSDSS